MVEDVQLGSEVMSQVRYRKSTETGLGLGRELKDEENIVTVCKLFRPMCPCQSTLVRFKSLILYCTFTIQEN